MQQGLSYGAFLLDFWPTKPAEHNKQGFTRRARVAGSVVLCAAFEALLILPQPSSKFCEG